MIEFENLKDDLKFNLNLFLENFKLHNYILEQQCIRKERISSINNVRIVDILAAYYEYLNQKFAELNNKIYELEQKIENEFNNACQIKISLEGLRDGENEKIIYINDYMCNPNFFQAMLEQANKKIVVHTSAKGHGLNGIDNINILFSSISYKNKLDLKEINKLYRNVLLSLKPFSLPLATNSTFPFSIHVTPYHEISYNGKNYIYSAKYSTEKPINVMFSNPLVCFIFHFDQSLNLQNIESLSLNSYYSMATNKMYKTYFKEDFLLNIFPYLSISHDNIPMFLTNYLSSSNIRLNSEKILESCSSYKETMESKTYTKKI